MKTPKNIRVSKQELIEQYSHWLNDFQIVPAVKDLGHDFSEELKRNDPKAWVRGLAAHARMLEEVGYFVEGFSNDTGESI